MNRLRKLLGLSWADTRLLFHATGLLLYAKLRLPLIDFRVDSGATEQVPAAASANSALALAHAQAVARLVGIAAASFPLRVGCLHRSLVLWWLLRRNGVACELRLGARNEPGPFEAHAWVQFGGVALNDYPGNLARYGAFGVAVVPVLRGSTVGA
jgi:Transglutaminase-like superfamily